MLITICGNIFCQEKHALIIALSDYNEGTNWQRIHSSRDANLISEALKYHGFDPKNIRVITDKKNGTKQGIIDAFGELILKVDRGDLVVFHFSGHGQLVMDHNGDELDGFDESIVPVDADKNFVPGVYHGERHITDDELGELLTKLRVKLGPSGDLLVTLDACHSGTATRGTASKRGTLDLMAPNDYRYNSVGVTDTTYGLYETGKNLSTMVVISATSPNEYNWEATDKNGKRVGSLSLALSKALISSNENTTYRGLFEETRRLVALNYYPQTPQIEGNMDRQVLGGKLLPQPKYFSVIKTSKFNPLEIEIDVGELHGIFPDSEVAFYPSDTRDLDTKTITNGVVKKSNEITSIVILDKTADENQILSSWGYVTNRNYGKMRVSLQLEIGDEQLNSLLLKAFRDYPFIELVKSNPDLLIGQNPDSDQISLLTGNGTLLYRVSRSKSPELNTQSILNSIIKYTQVNFLRHLENYNSKLKVRLEIIPVSTKRLGRSIVTGEKLPLQPKIASDGIPTFQKGEHFVCHFINEGSKGVYISLLDIQSDGELEILLPPKRKTPIEYFIKPGDTLKLDSSPFGLGEPFGIDILKVIATETELNLRSILDSQGTISQAKGKMINPFEELFTYTFKQQEKYRGTTSPSIPPSTAHISNLIIRVIPRSNN